MHDDERSFAVRIAEEHLANQNVRHGCCVAVERLFDNAWNVEFAYEGLNSRSETTDPPSIALTVDITSRTVTVAELM